MVMNRLKSVIGVYFRYVVNRTFLTATVSLPTRTKVEDHMLSDVLSFTYNVFNNPSHLKSLLFNE
jgi:hypothetical protein